VILDGYFRLDDLATGGSETLKSYLLLCQGLSVPSYPVLFVFEIGFISWVGAFILPYSFSCNVQVG
jgi:hypothetical protein